MKKTLSKIIVFTLILICLFILNQEVFRSDYPKLTIITLIGSVMILIYFPYNKFFNNKKQN